AGVLVGRRDWLDRGEPYLRGGGAVNSVTLDSAVWRTGPARHEAGSPNVVGVVALAKAIAELSALDAAAWEAHETALRERLVAGLAGLPQVRIHRLFLDAEHNVGVVSFSVDGHEAHRLAT